MDFLPKYFIIMVIVWIILLYFSHQIVIQIKKEEHIHVSMMYLRGKFNQIATLMNNTNHSH